MALVVKFAQSAATIGVPAAYGLFVTLCNPPNVVDRPASVAAEGMAKNVGMLVVGVTAPFGS